MLKVHSCIPQYLMFGNVQHNLAVRFGPTILLSLRPFSCWAELRVPVYFGFDPDPTCRHIWKDWERTVLACTCLCFNLVYYLTQDLLKALRVMYLRRSSHTKHVSTCFSPFDLLSILLNSDILLQITVLLSNWEVSCSSQSSVRIIGVAEVYAIFTLFVDWPSLCVERTETCKLTQPL